MMCDEGSGNRDMISASGWLPEMLEGLASTDRVGFIAECEEGGRDGGWPEDGQRKGGRGRRRRRRAGREKGEGEIKA